jgi:phosphohistidine swiveling domain-containing protein
MLIAHKTDAAGPAEIGGKACNLARLEKLNVTVPDWFALTSEFFERFLGDDLETYKEWLRHDSEESREAIINLIYRREFTDELRDLVTENIHNCLRKGKLAVRSSATDEDSSSYSFAGMMDSFLGVSEDDVFTAVKDCYASCFSKRAMEYRRGHHLVNDSIRMGVIIQEMIDSDYSGVMFTTNPQTNNPDETLISLVRGMGGKLVSGETDSQDYIVGPMRTIRNAGSAPDLQDGPTEDNSTKDRFMDDRLILGLYDLGILIEKSGAPRLACDIEFSIKDNKIYILQSRIITTYRHIDKSKFRTILDDSNIVESYPGVTTPLTFTFAREVYAKVYKQTLRNFFIPQEKIDKIKYDLDHMLAFYQNKVYYRLNSWYRMTALYPGYEKNSQYMENMMGVKIGLRETKAQARTRALKIYIRFAYKLLRIKKDSRRFVDKFNAVTGPYHNNTFEGYSNTDLIRVYQELEHNILDDFIIPITNDMGTMIFYGYLTDKVKRVSNHYEGLISAVLSRQGHVESAGQSLALIRIRSEIQKDRELVRLFMDKTNGEILKELPKYSHINSLIRDYISRYGARCMEELKLETITIQQEPERLIDLIRKYLNTGISTSEETVSDDQAFYRLFPFLERGYIRLIVRITKFFIRNREFLRLKRTYIYAIVRNIFLKAGRNFSEEGVIGHERDIFFLEKDEIVKIIRHELDPASVRGLIEGRKKAYQENKKKTAMERLYFYGDVTEENALPVYVKQEIDPNKHVLKGVAGGGGVVEGTVNYIESADDDFEEGSVLMARRTDPGWTVLFPMAKAVIIERGSVLSHSAVVAREMGIPLVAGVRGLTSVIRNHDRVRVDGINGTIELLKDSDEK